MKFWSRAARILLATLIATQGAALLPAMAASASQSKRLEVKAIGEAELKSEYGAGGGGGGTTDPIKEKQEPSPYPSEIATPQGREADYWEFYSTRVEGIVRMNSQIVGEWNNKTGTSPLKINQSFDGYCTVSGASVSSESIGVNFSCGGDNYGFKLTDYVIPIGRGLRVWKGIDRQNWYRIEWRVRRNIRTGILVQNYLISCSNT